MSAIAKFLSRWSALLLALGIVMCLQSVLTIEWSFPYCSSEVDGPAFAVFGMPLAYIQYSGVSSLEYEFMPLVYVLDLLFLLALAWPITARVLRKLPEKRRGIRIALGLTGVAVASLVTTGVVFFMSIGSWRPTWSLTAVGYYRYSDLRPVRFTTLNDMHDDCTPSPRWFPNSRTHK